MRRYLIILFFSIFLPCQAPVYPAFLIFQKPPVDQFEALFRASCIVESNGNRFAYNYAEGATGIVQIRPVRLRDYNKLTESHYTMADMFDPYISRKIFIYYARIIRDPESIARQWNGGPRGMQKESTIKYWNKIKKHL